MPNTIFLICLFDITKPDIASLCSYDALSIFIILLFLLDSISRNFLIESSNQTFVILWTYIFTIVIETKHNRSLLSGEKLSRKKKSRKFKEYTFGNGTFLLTLSKINSGIYRNNFKLIKKNFCEQGMNRGKGRYSSLRRFVIKTEQRKFL